MAETNWEIVDLVPSREYTERFPVPGGWLYRTVVLPSEGESTAVAMTFVPVPLVAIKEE